MAAILGDATDTLSCQPPTSSGHNSVMHLFIRPLRTALAWTLALASSTAALALEPQGQPQLNLPRTELRAGMFRIDAQVAQRFEERQIGLMHRTSMPAHEGMLFIFEQPAVQCFWMKNTLLPLTAAFVADDGSIVNLADMQPLDERSHCSSQPVRYVLEMHQGWFAQKGIRPGAKLTGRPFTAPSK